MSKRKGNERLSEKVDSFLSKIQFSQVSFDTKISMLNEVAKMTSIPHVNQMTADNLMQLLATSNFEKTEKMDGANWSAGVTKNGKTYTKTKRGKPETNPAAHFKLRDLNWGVYDAFGRSIQMLNKGGFPAWYKKIEKEYRGRIMRELKPKEYNGFGIFGEIFGSNQSNALAYDSDAVGNGALVVFGVKVDDGTPKGIEISTNKIGYEIMDKFVRKFDRVMGWRVYNKKPVGLKVNKTYVTAIKRFLKKYLPDIKNRKRDPDSLLRKVKAKQELERIVTNFKKDMLRQIDTLRSFMGDTEIEGVIIRNKDNGAIAKIVDVEKFTALNIKNWAGRSAMVDEKKQLYKDMIEKVVNSADIFVIQSKIQQKLGDYLEFKGKDKFDSLDELLAVIYEDAADEVKLKSAKAIQKDVARLINVYIKSVRKIIKETEDKQKDESTKIDEFNFNLTMNELKRDIEFMQGFLDKVKGSKTWTSIVEFLLGPKAIEDLVKNYVK